MPNEPAFPLVVNRIYYEGMTLLDYFAAKAMQGMLASGLEFHMPENGLSVEIKAYALANYMLKEREKYAK